MIDGSIEGSARIFGLQIIVSPYVPKIECFEEEYSRPLIVKMLHGRTVDIRTWEEDQLFLVDRGADWRGSPKSFGVIRNVSS